MIEKNYLCAKYNLALCAPCSYYKTLGNMAKATCQIEFFNSMIKCFNHKNDIKNYIVEVILNKTNASIYGKSNIVFLRKSIELYKPNYINFLDKILILLN